MKEAAKVTTAEVFSIAGPAMLANLTTPLLGVVATACIGRLGEPALLGGVAVASIVFDCLFWLFGFLRMGTVAFTAKPWVRETIRKFAQPCSGPLLRPSPSACC